MSKGYKKVPENLIAANMASDAQPRPNSERLIKQSGTISLYRIFLIRLIFFGLFFLSACIYSHTAVEEELGNNYYFIGDGGESQILLNLTPDREHKAGYAIVPADVLEYNYDSLYIIAKNRANDTCYYWIIDKSVEINIDKGNGRTSSDSLLQTNVTGPVDSAYFYDELNERDIEIQLKKGKLN